MLITADIEEIVRCAIKDYFNLKFLSDTDSIELLGGDPLDVIEIVMQIEDDLDMQDGGFEESFVDTFGKLTVKELIDKLKVYFNVT